MGRNLSVVSVDFHIACCVRQRFLSWGRKEEVVYPKSSSERNPTIRLSVVDAGCSCKETVWAVMNRITRSTYDDLSRLLSHALRHEPWVYELELDDEGWAPVGSLLAALREQRSEWGDLEASDLESVIEESSKKRHELRDGLIRALYGHSVAGKLCKVPADPPSILYHGTAPGIVPRISAEGLKPMGRQYVHLSVDEDTAVEVGRRKSTTPIILVVDAAGANKCGSVFYVGNEKVWLADEVPPEFIKPVP